MPRNAVNAVTRVENTMDTNEVDVSTIRFGGVG